VTALDYALALPTGTAVLVTKAEITVATRLAAEAAAFVATGQAAALKFTQAINAESGAYAVTGFGAGSVSNYGIGANYGYFELVGQVSQERIAVRVMAAGLGTIQLSGGEPDLKAARSISASNSSHLLTGRAAALKRTYFQTTNYTAPTNPVDFAFSGSTKEYNLTLQNCTAISYSSAAISNGASTSYFHAYTRYENGVVVDTSGATESSSTPGFTGTFSPSKTFRLRLNTSFSNYWPSTSYARFYDLSYSARTLVTSTS